MAKKSDECFLCGRVGKGRSFTSYSGTCKSGSTTRLMVATVTVLERWRDLRIYEIFVCRDCRLRLWAEHTRWPPILWGAGAGLALLAAVAAGALLALLAPLAIGLIVGGALGLLALAVGGAAVWFLLRHLARKPEHEALERLVVKEAMYDLGEPGQTFITVDQYTELIRMGIVDT